MAIAQIMRNVSGFLSTPSVFSGLEQLMRLVVSSFVEICTLIEDLGSNSGMIGLPRPCVADVLPFPTTNREVSGRNRAMTSKKHADAVVRNQKIERHPHRCISNPLRTGPKLGGVLRTKDMMPEVLPRSAGVNKSPRTPNVMANVPDIPAACKMRKHNRAGNDGDRASPMSAPRYMAKQTATVGRLPIVSAELPTIVGAIAATMRYTVMVRLMLATETWKWSASCGIAGK